ncbi:hypothetical protein SLS57_001614 [Botryosphaeria dothidea]
MLVAVARSSRIAQALHVLLCGIGYPTVALRFGGLLQPLRAAGYQLARSRGLCAAWGAGWRSGIAEQAAAAERKTLRFLPFRAAGRAVSALPRGAARLSSLSGPGSACGWLCGSLGGLPPAVWCTPEGSAAGGRAGCEILAAK